MSFQQFLLILRARWQVIVAVFVVTVGLISGLTLLQPKQYSATTSVVVDVKSPDLMTGLVSPMMMNSGLMATQLDIIKSPRVAKEVVRILKLDKSPELLKKRSGAEDIGALDEWIASLLQRGLEVLPSRESNVLGLTFTGASPEFAVAVANAYAQAYINVSLSLRVGPARQYADFFEQQGTVARDRLEAAQRKLSEYQKANNITAVDDKLDFESAKLNETAVQLSLLQAMATESRSKRQSANKDTVSEAMQSALVNQLRADIARLEGKLNESATSLGTAHPTTMGQQAELTALRAKLDLELKRITSSIVTSDDVNRQREVQLQALLATQKTHILALQQQRDDMKVLQRNVDSAQRAYDVLLARADQTNVESQVTQANISVLNPAATPTSPSKPKVLINILVSVFLGVVLGVGVAFIVELLNRRVRSTTELIDVLEVPLLGKVGSAEALMRPELKVLPR
jgi:succinoglycan biosynthesis transport protein ExoP